MKNRIPSIRKYQYLLSLVLILGVAFLGFILERYIGYKAVALMLLVAVSVLAMLFDIWPVLLAAVLSAIIWNFFFIPPRFTFQIRATEDILMFLMYFLIAMVNAVLTYKIKINERKVRDREEKEKSILLYNTLLNSLSHELRTPITTIMSATDTLKDNSVSLSVDTRSTLLNEIDIAGQRLNQQVENLLHMSRLESGMLQIKKDWCDLSDLIHTTIQKVSPEMQSRIRFQPDPQLPLFKLDPGLIEQAIFNIVTNALRYSPQQSPVDITVTNLQDSCQITVADQGHGISREEALHIFDKFYRSPKNSTGGTGLGLSIAKGFVEAHQGQITVKNNTAGGTVFTMTIPAEVSFINQIKHE